MHGTEHRIIMEQCDQTNKQLNFQAIANFMSKARGGRVKFDPDRVVMAGGATGANETVMFCLADPGDAFLVPSPYYPAYELVLYYIVIQFMFIVY